MGAIVPFVLSLRRVTDENLTGLDIRARVTSKNGGVPVTVEPAASRGEGARYTYTYLRSGDINKC